MVCAQIRTFEPPFSALESRPSHGMLRRMGQTSQGHRIVLDELRRRGRLANREPESVGLLRTGVALPGSGIRAQMRGRR